MTLVNFSDFETGDDATAGVFNGKFGALADAVNGNLDASNLADGAVTTPKLTAGSVTNAKLQTLQAARVYMASNSLVTSVGWQNFPADTLDYNQGFTITSNYKFTPTTPGFFNIGMSFSENDGASTGVYLAAIVVTTADNTYQNRAIGSTVTANITPPYGYLTAHGVLKVDSGQSILLRVWTNVGVRANGLAQRSGNIDDKPNYTWANITEIR